MDDTQALRIVSILANGANPLTGETFPSDSPYQEPDVIRALFVAQRALERAAQSHSPAPGPTARGPATATTPRNAANANAGKSWSADEDQQLLAEFDTNTALSEIARTHGRTVAGIRARLEKHGRLEPSTATRWPTPGEKPTKLS